MNSITKDFTTYDYLKMEVLPDLEQLYVDCYQSFGWEITKVSENTLAQDYYINGGNFNETSLIKLKFKRNRKIKNKAELLKLQKNMEGSFRKIDKLKKEPELVGTMYALILGIMGMLFIIFSILSFISKNPLYILGIINGVAGAIGLISAYFMYNKKRKQFQEKNEILIEEEYNSIYECCEKAHDLIR